MDLFMALVDGVLTGVGIAILMYMGACVAYVSNQLIDIALSQRKQKNQLKEKGYQDEDSIHRH
ncbi:hypothetical protein [Hutsoniella sourekii]|uniref:hypothetical protein n=1 Tax=Hutsoniella sourekii TaxID=87650 RepID=UPI000480B6B2|nr:hypothetical protein [Hutsoniella sourekii]